MGKRERQRAKGQKKDFKKKKQQKSLPPPSHGGGGGGGGGAGGGGRGAPTKGSVTYEKGLKILVLGDGDFSFSRGLMLHLGGSGKGLVCTAYDDLKTVVSKYGAKAEKCLESIKKGGGVVRFGVDATKLHKEFAGEGRKFDRVVFNFPHTGEQRVHMNRHLLQGFFKSARAVLAPKGEVHVTLKLKPPYSRWGAEEQASSASMCHVRTLHFDQKQFPGYRHKTTKDDAKTFVAAAESEAKHCKTLVFMPAMKAAGAGEGTAGGGGAGADEEKSVSSGFLDFLGSESDSDSGTDGES